MHFVFLRQQTIESLNINIQEYEHIVTGASHIHLASEQAENVFLVALKTMPQDFIRCGSRTGTYCLMWQ